MAGVAIVGQKPQQTLLVGSGGDDTLLGGLGRDVIDTGAGDNVVWADLAASASIWSMAEASGKSGRARIDYDRVAARDIDAAILRSIGVAGRLTADQQRQLSDVINGGSGEDLIFAGQGHDTVNGGGGNDRILAGGGNDVASGGTGDDVIDGGDGNDTLSGDAGQDTLLGDAGSDVIFGGFGADLIEGEAGNDTIWGGTEADAEAGDTVAGGEGNDWIFGEGGRDSLDGGGGRDGLWGGTGDDTIFGGAGGDSLSGGAGDDVLDGGDDNDELDGGAGADTVDGGRGDDLAIFVSDPRQRTTDVYFGGAGNDTLRLVLGAAQYDAYAQALAPLLQRMTGELVDFSKLEGAAGAAPLRLQASGFEKLEIQRQVDPSAARPRADTAFTSGADAVDFDGLATGVTVGFAALGGNDEVLLASARSSPAGYVSSSVFEAGDGDDTVVGRDRDDRIDGGAGNDQISGGAGNDEIWGGEGADRIAGEGGNNIVDGGAGNDTIALSGADGGRDADGKVFSAVLKGRIDGGRGADLLTGAAGATLVVFDGGNLQAVEAFSFGAGADRLILSGYGATTQRYTIGMGAGDDTVAGSLGDDFVAGDGGHDRLEGGQGNDTLLGGAGNDWLDGGDGADLIHGGEGVDTLTAGAGDDVLFGEGGRDVLSAGAGRDALHGGAGDDTLTGSAAGDDAAVLFGDEGNDDLTAGAGTDALFGGDGADTVRGGGGAGYLSGGDGGDVLIGVGGDTLNGGGGDDTIQGTGTDMLMLAGNDTDFAIVWDAGRQVFTVTDLRTGTGEGVDIVSGIGTFRFANADRTPEDLRPKPTLSAAFQSFGEEPAKSVDARTIVLDVLNTLRRVRFDNAPAEVLDVRGGDGPDRAEFSNYDSQGGLRIDLGSRQWNLAGLARGALSDVEAVTAGAGYDTLIGSAAADSLDGGAGEDEITGGGGADVLTGGEGSDRFVLDGAQGVARVTDFSTGDFVVFRHAGFGLPAMPSLFEGSHTSYARDLESPYLLFDASTRGLYLDRTGRGSEDAVLVATFDGVTTLAGAVTFG